MLKTRTDLHSQKEINKPVTTDAGLISCLILKSPRLKQQKKYDNTEFAVNR